MKLSRDTHFHICSRTSAVLVTTLVACGCTGNSVAPSQTAETAKYLTPAGRGQSVRPPVPLIASMNTNHADPGSVVSVTLIGAHFVAGDTAVQSSDAGLTVTDVRVVDSK